MAGETMVSGYSLQRQIGFGPLGVVWEADGPEGAVAVTVVADLLAGAPDTRAALCEATAGAMHFDHPGLVRALGFREADGQLLLVAELLAGETLATRLQRKPPLTAAETVRLATALAEVLAYLHARKIVHGGINPENIFLTGDNRVKLLHTGAARVQVEALLRLGSAVAGETTALAPELGAGGKLDAAADIWSLGHVLRLCRQGAPAESAPAAIGEGKPLVHSGTLDEQIARCLQNSPSARPKASAILYDLAGEIAETETPGDRRKVSRRVLWGLGAASCLLLAGLAVAGWYLATHPAVWSGLWTRQPARQSAAARRGAAPARANEETPAAAGEEASVKARLRAARFGAPAACVDGKVYVFGGQTSGRTAPGAECFDPTSRRVTEVEAEFIPRAYHSARALDGLVYLVGGIDEAGPTGKLEIFDPAGGEVKSGTAMPTARYNASAAVLDGKLYVAGGSTRAATDLTDVLEIYDPAKDRWTAGAPLPSPRQTELVAWGRKIYALGGFPGEGSSDDCYTYDPASDAWSTLAALPYPVSAHRAIALGSEMYAFGSYDQLDQVLRFKDRVWERVAVAFVPRRHAAIAADRDRLWVIGGTADGSKPLDAIQEFTARQLATAAAQ